MESPNTLQAQGSIVEHNVLGSFVSFSWVQEISLELTCVSSAIAGAVKTYFLKQLRSRVDFTCKSPAAVAVLIGYSKANKYDRRRCDLPHDLVYVS